MSKNKLSRLLPCLAAGAALLLAASPATVVAQPPPPGTPPAGAPGAPPPGAPPGGFKLPGLPRQGFDNNGQNPASYNADEKAAVAVAEKWIETINSRDADGHMALIADNILFRADPTQQPMRGARKYCSHMVGIGGAPSPEVNTSFTMSELYVVGGKGEAQVLFYRHDINGPAGTAGFLGGYRVPVAVFLRIRNGKVIEWYDMPTNKISIGALPFSIPTGMADRIPPQCAKFPEGST